MTTIDELFESDLLKDNFQILKTVCRNISTQPIRNMATVGGNLTCRYTWTEMPAAMIGLDATMHFTDGLGKKEELRAEDFFKTNAKTNKLFTHVSIKRDATRKIAYRRVKKTQFIDIPLLSVMINVKKEKDKFNSVIVAVNNCVTFAQRDKILEEYLTATKISSSLAQASLDHLDNSIYDTRSSDYKKHMFRVSIQSAIEELTK